MGTDKYKTLVNQKLTDSIMRNWRKACQEKKMYYCPLWFWLQVMQGVHGNQAKTSDFIKGVGIQKQTLYKHKNKPMRRWTPLHCNLISNYTLIPYDIVSGEELPL